MDDQRDDERAPGDRGTQQEPEALHVPQMTQPTTGEPAVAVAQPADNLSGTAALSADITTAWNNLGRNARLLVNGSAAALILVLIGLPLSIWDSATFALLVLTAGVFTIVTAWFGATPTARSMPIPVSSIELIATQVAAILAIMKVIEVVFDFETDGVIGLVVAIALGVATVVMVVAATRRGADALGAITRGDQGVKVAAAGLALVLVGWVINLSVGFWTMSAAALPLAVLVIAALTVAEAPRITSPVPVAWVGTGIAVFGAILAIGHWDNFARLGRSEVSLDAIDYLGFLGYALGAVLIIAGGVLSGRDVWRSRPPSVATTPSAPTAPWVPATPLDAPTEEDRVEPAG